MHHSPLALFGGAVLAVTVFASGVADVRPAAAATYPSWSDVLAARGSEAAKKQRVTELQGFLSSLRTQAQSATAKAQELGNAFARAQQAADAAGERAASLRAEATQQQQLADQTATQAGELAAQSARTGGHDLSASLMADGAEAEDLLQRLGSLAKLTERSSRLSDLATTEARSARSLTDQADRAEQALDDRAKEAEQAMAAAQRASDAAQSAVAAQETNEARLEAQLATLTSGRIRAESEFKKGEEVRIAAEAAARRAAEEAARRAAAAAAAAAARPKPGTGGGGGGVAPNPGNPGGGGTPNPGASWIRPGGGYISSPYGHRVHPITGVVTKHDGVDLAAGCSTGILAASAGTVSYVGWYGGYGNYVKISHGNGISTAYGHIVNGGFRVKLGQQVSAGTLIALVGNTGNSTGCHLHYETHVGTVTTDPVPFMASRGAPF